MLFNNKGKMLASTVQFRLFLAAYQGVKSIFHFFSYSRQNGQNGHFVENDSKAIVTANADAIDRTFETIVNLQSVCTEQK